MEKSISSSSLYCYFISISFLFLILPRMLSRRSKENLQTVIVPRLSFEVDGHWAPTYQTPTLHCTFSYAVGLLTNCPIVYMES